MLTVFAVFYGLDWVATVPPTVKLAAQHFGAEKSGLVFGWIFAGHQLGGATAALLAGIARTTLDTYTPALLLAGVFCVLAALLILTIGNKPRPQAADRPGMRKPPQREAAAASRREVCVVLVDPRRGTAVAAASTCFIVLGLSKAPSKVALPMIGRTAAAWRASTEWICSAVVSTGVPSSAPAWPL